MRQPFMKFQWTYSVLYEDRCQVEKGPFCCYVYIPSTNPFAHPSHPSCPSCLYYYLLSTIYCFCTSYLFLHILLVLHILFCTFLYPITLYFSFLPIYIYICSCVVLLLYNFYSLHCPLSGPDLIYISLLIIPCIIDYVTNKETLNLGLLSRKRKKWNMEPDCATSSKGESDKGRRTACQSHHELCTAWRRWIDM